MLFGVVRVPVRGVGREPFRTSYELECCLLVPPEHTLQMSFVLEQHPPDLITLPANTRLLKNGLVARVCMCVCVGVCVCVRVRVLRDVWLAILGDSNNDS